MAVSEHLEGGNRDEQQPVDTGAGWKQSAQQAWPYIRWIIFAAAVFAFLLFGIARPRTEIFSWEATTFRMINIVLLVAAYMALRPPYVSNTRFFIFLTAAALLSFWI